MLLHQLILALFAAAKRFDSVLLGMPASVRRLVSRVKADGSDLQET